MSDTTEKRVNDFHNIRNEYSNLMITNSIPMNTASIIALRPFDQDELNRLRRSPKHKDNSQLFSIKNNKIKLQKSLINKPIRFYEPIKDAEMLIQLERLRTKLTITRPIESHNQSLVEEQDVLNESKIEESNVFHKPKPTPRKELDQDEEDNNNMDHSINREISKSAALELNMDEIYPQDDESTNLIYHFNSKKSVTSIGIQMRQKKEEERLTAPYNSTRVFSETFSSLKRNSLLTERHKKEQESSITVVPSNMFLAQSKVQRLVRRATKNRLDNIYVTDDPNFVQSQQKNTSIIIETNREERCQSESLNQDRPYSKSYRPKTANESKEFKLAQLNMSRKLHPTIKHHIKKIDEVEPVQNIINDIPSTIQIMSKKGKATNIEKIIAFKLSDYYTNYRLAV